MRRGTTLHGVQGSGRSGVVSGYVLKLIREAITLTQSDMAEQLGVDLATVQGWESGRRPLMAVRPIDFSRLRAHLIRLGATPAATLVLREAIDADVIITEILRTNPEASGHPLSLMVHRKNLSNLISWPFTGTTPDTLRSLPVSETARRGPSLDRPVLPQSTVAQFFDNLQLAADQARRQDAGPLRRQATYLLAFDRRETTRNWLTSEHRAALNRASGSDSMESWISVRSSAMALAHTGDSDTLDRLIAISLSDDRYETANLNYWAYWVGETPSVQPDDTFMGDANGEQWSGMNLCEHILDRLTTEAQHLTFNIHTLSSLLLARPHLLEHWPTLRRGVADRLESLHVVPELPQVTRRELANVAYAVRLASR